MGQLVTVMERLEALMVIVLCSQIDAKSKEIVNVVTMESSKQLE